MGALREGRAMPYIYIYTGIECMTENDVVVIDCYINIDPEEVYVVNGVL